MRTLLIGVLSVAVIGAVVCFIWPARTPTPSWAAEYDVASRAPEVIPPGTVIGTTAPEGWSHLIIKSLPRVRPTEVPNVPNNVVIGRSGSVKMASWMFTAFVADVRSEPRGTQTIFRLRAIALGLGTNTGGRDVILTPETARDYGVELGWITRTILTTGYKTLGLAMVVVHGDTFGLIDTPVWFRTNGKNELIRFRYALLVDSATGRLDAIVWRIGGEDQSQEYAAAVLNPNTIDEAELIPDVSAFDAVGIPSEAAFGIDGLPPHRAHVLLPSNVRPLASQAKFSPGEAADLEADLRRLFSPVSQP